MPSLLLAVGSVVVAVSLLLPWFEGRVSGSAAGFSGYDFGLAIFFCAVVAVLGAAGSWAAFEDRYPALVVLALIAGVLTLLFAGFAMALSSTMGRVVSLASASDVVGASVRSGVIVLFIGALILSLGGLIWVVKRGGTAGRLVATSLADDAKYRATGTAPMQGHGPTRPEPEDWI